MYSKNGKKTHGKQYSSQTEEEHRHQVFEANYEWVFNYNTNGSKSATMAINQFADLTREEFKMLMGVTTIPSLLPQKKLNHSSPPMLMDIPASIDWRTKGAVTPVKNQLDCGDSWAFSVTGGLEALYFLKNGSLPSFSEQHLLDCSPNLPPGQNACHGDGGSINHTYEYVVSHGTEREEDYPYVGEVQQCAYNESKVAFRISGFNSIEQYNNDELLLAVSKQPVSVMVEVDSEEFQFYEKGVLTSYWCGTTVNHSVLIVGYGKEDGKDYWLVKNSWGTSWGNKGYIKIWREKGESIGECGICTMGFYPVI